MVFHDAPTERPDPGDPELQALVTRCLEAIESGNDDPVEDVCRDCPERIAEVRVQLEQLADLGRSGGSATLAAIDGYRLVRVLGKGGMGTVYLAHQAEPVQRDVALKLIRSDFDSAEIIARFESERQALARMSHPGIAQVFDAGQAPSGRPYFVMEYVDGVPLTEHSTRHELDVTERVRLFIAVCHAVQHAHEKGIIHRDLKPSNVLVTRTGAASMPKVIDFGIAKATEGSQDAGAQLTRQNQVLGTLEYMSPEQAGTGGRDVDTRTDVYSLGVMLYELLCGELPFDSARLHSVGPLEFARIVRDELPRPPSARAGTSTTSSTTRQLRGELDWIVLRALEKDRLRRYASPLALADDLERHLRNEPISAGPPTFGYRISKLVRRHRVEFAAAAAIVVTLVVSLVSIYAWATSERLAKEQLAVSVAEFDQLKAVVLLEEAVAEEQHLHPAWPHRIDAMRRWLEDGNALLAMKPRIEDTVRELRTRAEPRREADAEHDLRTHPRFDEWQELAQRVAALQYAEDVRNGARELDLPPPGDVRDQLQPGEVVQIAWQRVAPWAPPVAGKGPDRRHYGEEPLGLACARLAMVRFDEAGGGRNGYAYWRTLAWALVANGQDDEAKLAAAKTTEVAAQYDIAGYDDFEAAIADAIDTTDATLERLRNAHARLGDEVRAQRTWRLPTEAAQFLHDALTRWLDDVDRVAEKQITAVQSRLRWAESVGALTANHPAAPITWDDVRTAIASSERYARQLPAIDPTAMTGLVPLGANPNTGLQEFYHLRSAWDGERDPQSIPLPARAADGTFAVDDDTGIVFVLLPGDTFAMGAQRTDPTGRHFHQHAEDAEDPVHDVTLAPFLLARHELTQGQWARLWIGDAARRQPSRYAAGYFGRGMRAKVTLAHPVELVTHAECTQLLDAYALQLPTEAQWEFACRAGSDGPWHCEADRLGEYANIADQAWRVASPRAPVEDWNDGYVISAPVGSFLANAFGLHDLHGNVWEWCRDRLATYDNPPRAGDGLRGADRTSREFICRGGSFAATRGRQRTSYRNSAVETASMYLLGLRPARALRPSR